MTELPKLLEIDPKDITNHEIRIGNKKKVIKTLQLKKHFDGSVELCLLDRRGRIEQRITLGK